MGKKNQDKIAYLQKRRSHIDAQISSMTARQKAEKKKKSMRRKIILGDIIVKEIDNNPELSEIISALIKEHASKSDMEFLQEWEDGISLTFRKSA